MRFWDFHTFLRLDYSVLVPLHTALTKSFRVIGDNVYKRHAINKLMKHFGWNKYVLLYEQDVKVSDADESGILYIVKDECMCVGKSNKKDIRVHCSPL